MFEVGQRVRHIGDDLIGHIVGTVRFGRVLVLVRFPGSESAVWIFQSELELVKEEGA